MHPERRTHPRNRPEPGVVCTCTSANFTGHGGEHFNMALRLLDIAPRGACVVTVDRLRERAPVILDVTVPRTLGRLKARAVVRWSVTVERDGRTAHVAGLRFDRVLESYGDRRQVFSGGREEAPRPVRDPRRRYKRFSPKHGALECDPHDLRRILGLRSNPALRLKDLCRGGAQVVCSKELKKGSRVDLKVELPVVRGEISIETQVRWCRRDTLSLEPRWNAGLVFIRMSPEHEERIREMERFHLG